MSLAVERYRGPALPAVYELRGERRLILRRTLGSYERPPASESPPLLAFRSPRRGWRPEDAASAYGASLAAEPPGPSIDLYA
jgi:hypothetical protein